MAKKSKSPSKAAAYTAYEAENRAAKNKERRMQRHLKKHPNDEQTAASLKAGGERKRCIPKSRMWNSGKIRYAQILKSMGLNGHRALGDPRIDNAIEQRENERTKQSKGKR